MNTVITSREDIMRECRLIVAEKGLKTLNMRLVAGKCHIALGTLYNYYADKDELVLATVESIWKDIFHAGWQYWEASSFSGYVEKLYAHICQSARLYPHFLTGHSISIAGSKQGEAKGVMEHTFVHMKSGMLKVLQEDSAVAENAFSPAFSEEAFIDFVLNNLLILLVKEQQDCSVLLEIINRVIYE